MSMNTMTVIWKWVDENLKKSMD